MTIKQTHKYALFLISLLLCILIQFSQTATIAKDLSTNKTEIQTKLVAENYTTNQIQGVIKKWQNLLKNAQGFDLATIHANLASAYNQIGQTSEAIAHWQQAAAIYEKANNEVKLAETLIDQAQAYNLLGQFTRAISLLEKSIPLIDKSDDTKAMATAWGVLGNSYSATNKYSEALAAYRKSLDIAETLDVGYVVTALNNQVATWRGRANWYKLQAKLAEEQGSSEEQELLRAASRDLASIQVAANRALKLSYGSNNLSEVKALLNLLSLSPDQNQYQQQASNILAKLPSSRRKAYSLIKLATYQVDSAKVNSLELAISISADLNDWRTQSFALGDLGYFYEQQKDWQLAMKYTRSAILAAQKVMAKDSLYRWQWQAGRIYNANHSTNKAIVSYKEAITSLQSIRSNVASASRDLQFEVRDEVEPVYRQLIGLLLNNESRTNVSEALDVAELLKLTELQNFFGDECLEAKTIFNSPVQTQVFNGAIINTLISEKETYLILQVENKAFKYLIPISKLDLENKVKDFRYLLEDASADEYLNLSQELYNLLIKPIQPALNKFKPNELTFVNDGILRNVPMAVLHDGKCFLIENYPISYALSNNSIDRDSQKFKSGLFFGLTESTLASSVLPNVKVEIDNIQNIIGGTKVLGESFTEINFERQLQKQKYFVVHIATHGEFKGTVNSSSLQTYNSRISLQEFDDALRSRQEPIELLTLSACQTAVGDDRSTLGLAGLAARNGVKNILASLWFANDSDTATLMQDFYSQIAQKNISKAEALRNAQLKIIRDRANHPGRWASFILING